MTNKNGISKNLISLLPCNIWTHNFQSGVGSGGGVGALERSNDSSVLRALLNDVGVAGGSEWDHAGRGGALEGAVSLGSDARRGQSGRRPTLRRWLERMANQRLAGWFIPASALHGSSAGGRGGVEGLSSRTEDHLFRAAGSGLGKRRREFRD